MTIRVGLTHRTSYTYDKTIMMGPQTLRLRPAPHARTPIVSYSQSITPQDHFLNWQQDPFGNYQARAVIPNPTDRFEVVVDLVCDMIAINPFDFFLDEDAFHAPFTYEDSLRGDLAPYLTAPVGGRLFGQMADATAKIWRQGGDDHRTIDALVEINHMVEQAIAYTVRMEPGVQTPEETLKLAKGSCRDSSWLLVNLLRHVGVAARFVSGYLIQLAPDEKPLEGPGGPDADFTDLHAWVEAFVPGAGWIGLDPTSGLFASEGHIPLAATPTPRSAAPITGGLDPCEVEFDFEMKVERLREPARISLPFTETVWAQINRAGQIVDQVLDANDIRLTMGGEPTFVAANDRDAEEWTIDAVGPTKRVYADQLARRLRERFAPGGLLTHGQGKWYPGEPLPRWAFGITWRKDGEPLWRNADLIAEEKLEAPSTLHDAERFTKALCAALDVAPDHAQPAFEDPARYLLQEAQLPENLSPANNNLDDPVDRRRLARVFERGLTPPAAFILPLQQAQADGTTGRAVKWMSEIWRTRRGKLFLIPGDSPAGFRLPMNSLPHIDPIDFPHVFPADPMEERPPLPKMQSRRISEDVGDPLPTTGDPAPVRTALVIEPRDGFINVFLPPTSSAEAYVDLIASVEAAAEAAGGPVRLEGYSPPNDPRFGEIKVTPDPGVIEVNIHPSADWEDLRDKTEVLYEEARAIGLDASGFMVDGRPIGSGGGAHVTVGGATPFESPFLRRPDVLGSLIRFWQNHPSLSYLFSGLFLGPTSQAPRADEARSDILYDLEMALDQLPGPNDTDFPPWLVDRVLRHLLVDVTGNTHRAEICIDKLYSPDGTAGRLGLVEFRAFEMPPHWRMNVAQQLVIRSLIAWFWKEPYRERLIEFGTALHDRFMLPDVLWADFGRVLDKVSRGLGLRLEREWFRAQFDFRFPLAGQIEQDGTTLELRSALEPWHVLGEEGATSGTARFVDASVERLQVKLTGTFPGEGLGVACNGRLLPLQPGELGAEKIAGVRFRTWLPASALHPTIPPHGPLIFDLVDLQAGRAIGGCTYHPTHPGGRNFETRPINALEAEGRRLARFQPFGHSAPGTIFKPADPDARCPYTLDLRRS